MSDLAVITGATGFIGGHLLEHFSQSGWRVRALSRRPPDKTPQSAGVDWVYGDFADPDILSRLVRDARVVVHCAGAVKARRRRDFFTINQQATEQMVAACARAATPPRFVLVSSLAAREPQLSDYAASKRAGEQALAAIGAELDQAIVRPPAVYGPGDFEILAFFKAVKAGIAPLPVGGRGRLSLIAAHDLCAAIVSLAGAPGVAGCFEVDDGAPGGYSLRELMDTLARLADARPFYIPLPRAALAATGALNLAAARLTGRVPMLTPGKARELAHPDWVSNSGALERATGWRPVIGLEHGLRETLAWYREKHLL